MRVHQCRRLGGLPSAPGRTVLCRIAFSPPPRRIRKFVELINPPRASLSTPCPHNSNLLTCPLSQRPTALTLLESSRHTNVDERKQGWMLTNLRPTRTPTAAPGLLPLPTRSPPANPALAEPPAIQRSQLIP